jgi:nucleotide-binding universal stress UspA family protein
MSDTKSMEAKGMPDNDNIQIRRILVPIDGSEHSIKAAKYATRIAKADNAEISCIHVITPGIPYGYATPAASTVHQHDEEIKHKIESWFDEVRDIAKNEGISDVKTDIFVDVKSVIESILDYASSKGIDLIVVGTKGRTGLKRLLMGSIANGIVHHANCPVLLVK